MRLSIVRPARVALLAVALIGACNSASSGSLTGHAWEWMGSSLPGATTIANPTNYTIQFATGGSFSSKVNCNQMSGTWTTSGSNGISIKPGPTTLALCPDPDLSPVFLTGLSTATTYAIAGNQLTLTAPNGTMTFQ